MDIKAIAAALGELPKDAGAEQIHAVVEAEIMRQVAIDPKLGEKDDAPPAAEPAADLSADAQEPSKEPSPDDANPGTPAALTEAAAVVVEAAPLPAAAPPPPAEGAGGTEPNAQPPASGSSPELAAAEEAFGMLKQATGLDDAAALAWLREHMDALAGLAKAAPATDAPLADTVQLTRTLGVAEGQIAALSARLAEYEARDGAARADAEKAKRAAVEARVEALIACGRALDTQRESLVTAALETPAWFEKHVATMPQIVPVGTVAARRDGTDKSGAAEDLTGIDDETLAIFDRQLRSIVPNAKERRALAIRAIRERMTATTGRA